MKEKKDNLFKGIVRKEKTDRHTDEPPERKAGVEVQIQRQE